MNDIAEGIIGTQTSALHWEPLAKGEAQPCHCEREGCVTTLTVLNIEENAIEIYQADMHSPWSCIARVVLPADIALCLAVI